MATPIYVPSKGRVKNATFLQRNSDPRIIIVVEPDEYPAYAAEYPKRNFMILPESNRGITYVRNYIKRNASSRFYWMIDDDVSQLYHREGTKMVKDDLRVLDQAQDEFIQTDIALGALDYQQFAWGATRSLIINGFCDVCVWVDREKTAGIDYREYLEGKEDRDFAMQVIAAGLTTARSTLYAFSAPKNGSNAGGLKESFYDKQGREAICAQRMVETWAKIYAWPLLSRTVAMTLKSIGKK